MPVWPGTGPVWVMGCGNMGGALLRRWLECGLKRERVCVIDPAPAQITGVCWQADFPGGTPDLLILGIKPQMFDELAPGVTTHIGPNSVVVSMLAGIDCARLRQAFPLAKAVVRTMPNLPVLLGKGVTALYSPAGPCADAEALFAPTGLVEWLNDEEHFHALTAVSGSGPAFVYRFIGALADGGTALGLPADQALRLARATVEGAAALSIAAGDDPAELAQRVTSPGGTTAEGLAVLDKGGEFVRIIAETQAATARRSQELGKA